MHRYIIILHKCTKNHDNLLHCSWDVACNGCTCYSSFWAIFFSFTPLTAQKIKSLEISSFCTCTKNYDQMMYGSWDMVRDGQTDRQTDTQTELMTYRGSCPPKKLLYCRHKKGGFVKTGKCFSKAFQKSDWI